MKIKSARKIRTNEEAPNIWGLLRSCVFLSYIEEGG